MIRWLYRKACCALGKHTWCSNHLWHLGQQRFWYGCVYCDAEREP
jgi:hypothetical protein